MPKLTQNPGTIEEYSDALRQRLRESCLLRKSRKWSRRRRRT